MLFIDPSSLGYSIQGISILEKFMTAAKGPVIVETDPRLVPLFERSYQYPQLKFVATTPEMRLPLPNGGAPDAKKDDIGFYFAGNAGRLAGLLGIDDDRYDWSTLLRPEIAAPFDTLRLPDEQIPAPKPAYLLPDQRDIKQWSYYFETDAVPVLITWNKGVSQHGPAAQQNLDANDVAFILRELHRTSDVKLSFHNAVHGITPNDYAAVNSQLSEDARLYPIFDVKNGEPFDVGQKIDRLAAFMSAAKSRSGIMLGVGNTYQHLWYAVGPRAGYGHDQIVVLPNGDFPTKPTWELQARQPNSPTIVVSKYSDFATNRTDTLLNIVAQARNALRF